MDLSAIEISAAGMQVQRRRMDLVAANLANVDTTSARTEPLRPQDGPPGVRHVPYRRQVASIVQGVNGLPSLRVTGDASAFREEQQPEHPHATAAGTVFYPNVNPMVEMVDLISASRAYEANLTAVEVAKSMHQSALRILG
ncbi:MAG TPA: flagellar basal body rod protein FlgC [Planctomycetota bacterium]|jgi:flagellar basal-body rod protein FlgC|nr:flagellar basal body rod protein FlgC [Planctomycetota bacterium]